MWSGLPIVVPLLTAFVLVGDCGGAAGFVSWNATGQGAVLQQETGGCTGVVACRLDPARADGRYVLETCADGPGDRSWAALACRASPSSPVDCLRGDRLRAPDGWSVTCDLGAGRDGTCVCSPR